MKIRRPNRFLIAPLFCACLMVGRVPVLSAPIIDDHFDDGAIGTNTNGPGNGFNIQTESGGSVAESGSIVSVNAEAGTFTGRAAITSKDNFPLAGTPVHIDVTGTNNLGNRIVFEFHQGSEEPFIGTASDWFRLDLFSSDRSGNEDDLRITSRTDFVTGDDPSASEDDGQVEHEFMDDHGLDLTSPFTASFDLRETDYDVILRQGGSPVTSLSDSWDGDFALSHITDGSGLAYFSFQSQGVSGNQSNSSPTDGTAMEADIDRVVVTPEPTSLALFLILGLALLRRRGRN